jgi:hypothetical protein
MFKQRKSAYGRFSLLTAILKEGFHFFAYRLAQGYNIVNNSLNS